MLTDSGIKKIGLFLLCFTFIPSSFAWNSVGHRVIAQIAYDHLHPHAKRTFNRINRALDNEYQSQSLVNASVWLDRLRYQDVNWFNSFHYIDWFFTNDDSRLPTTSSVNALWAIKEATHVLKSKKSSLFDKGIGLRILIHVAGDLHQPLHAASRVSKVFPEGDSGGNDFKLGPNPVGENLHLYWDKGGGYLIKQHRYSTEEIKKLARAVEVKYPCYVEGMDNKAENWAKESHNLALNVAYKIKEGSTPDENYQQNAQVVTEKRLALAGCRLASVLNHLDSASLKSHDKKKKKKENQKKVA